MPKMKTPAGPIFAPWPQFAPGAARRVADILRTGRVNYWTGPEGRRFESAFADWADSPFAVSVSSGTAALHVALAALGVGPGDEVVCPSCSFIASSFCALHAGARPVFVDTGPDLLIDPARIEAAVTPRTKAVVVVHLYGQVADMGPVLEIARRRGLFVVEDCAQCLGGVWRGRKAGTIGDVGCFSFCQSKHFTTGGEGGMVCCADPALARECRALRDHGCDGETAPASSAPRPHRRIGYNFRMTEIQSAIGLCELARFDRWNLPRRRMLGRFLRDALAGHPLVKGLPVDTPERENSYWHAPFLLDASKLACTVPEFIAALRAEGAAVRGSMRPEMYSEEAYREENGFGARRYPFRDPAGRRIDYARFDCRVARESAASTVAFWTHPVYTLANMRAEVRAFRRVADERMKR